MPPVDYWSISETKMFGANFIVDYNQKIIEDWNLDMPSCKQVNQWGLTVDIDLFPQ